jgi:hypothetical protein
MSRISKESIAFEAIMILTALTLICIVSRLWPLFLFTFIGAIFVGLRLLYSIKKNKNDDAKVEVPAECIPKTDSEQDLIRIAFGILQQRVTEQVSSRYPSARWIWEASNVIDRFADEQPLTIMLNSAGGFKKAEVGVHNLRFCGLSFKSENPEKPIEPPPCFDADGDTGDVNKCNSNMIDYTLIAYEWVEANMLVLNSKCNKAIAEKETRLFIPAVDLPHGDSWSLICNELKRTGFVDAKILSDGIRVNIPNNN